MADYPELAGCVALVTGAARGIGAAIARAFAAAGCKIAINDFGSEPEAEALRAAIADGGGTAAVHLCDIRDADGVREMVARVEDELGPIDFLINNAGITRDGVVWKMSDDGWNDVIDTNLTGCFHLIRAVAPGFRARQSGRIVNIASINGLRGKFGQSNYAASKAGLVGLTQSVARELGRSQVTVNAIAPGLIETEMTAAMPDDAKAAALAEIVLERIGTPADIAATVLFLCSDGARHITGEVIKVDGGQYM